MPVAFPKRIRYLSQWSLYCVTAMLALHPNGTVWRCVRHTVW